MIARLLRRLRSGRTLRPLPVRDAYRLWAERYPAESHNALMQAEERAVRDLLPDVQDQTILDLACGSGRYARIAASLNARSIIGIDLSDDMLRVERRDDDRRFVQADMRAVPLATACVDGVICGLAVGHVNELDWVYSEVGRVLRSGGWAVITDFHPFLVFSGKQRTFTAPDGRVYAVEHYPHLVADHVRAARDVGLAVEDVREPQLAVSGSEMPVVLALRLRKSERS